MAYRLDCECDECVVTRDWTRDNIPADWFFLGEAYRFGTLSPNYPMPATLDVSDTAVAFSYNALAINAITVRYFKERLRR